MVVFLVAQDCANATSVSDLMFFNPKLVICVIVVFIIRAKHTRQETSTICSSLDCSLVICHTFQYLWCCRVEMLSLYEVYLLHCIINCHTQPHPIYYILFSCFLNGGEVFLCFSGSAWTALFELFQYESVTMFVCMLSLPEKSIYRTWK